MDTEYREQLAEQLKMKRRLYHEFRMKEARAGIYVDPSVTIQREDLEREIYSIERELGGAPMPTAAERQRTYAPPPARYVEPPQVFQERMVGEQVRQRQADIEHQVKLLGIHRRNLGHLRAQLKELGAYAPPYVRNSLGDAMQSIAGIKRTLRDMGQLVDDLPGDE
jgi:hypothetical protein